MGGEDAGGERRGWEEGGQERWGLGVGEILFALQGACFQSFRDTVVVLQNSARKYRCTLYHTHSVSIHYTTPTV